MKSLTIYLLCFVIHLSLEASYPRDTETPLKYTTVLTIAGSDPSGGAGIQADLKTFSALHCYGMSAITALTAQNTVGVQSVYPIPNEFILEQLNSIFNDIEVDAIKIGMLGKKDLICGIADFLQSFSESKKRIVVDPVLFAKSGDQLVGDDSIQMLKEKILPLATVLTPNLQEASKLLGLSKITGEEEMEQAAFALLELGPQAVVIKGKAKDCLAIKDHKASYWLEAVLIPTENVHGTGCTFSAAIASYLAKGESILDSVTKAKTYISTAIEKGSLYRLGHGKGPVFHYHTPLTAPSFTEEAWLESSSIYEKIKHHPFIIELGSGKLSRNMFQSYLEQDYLFLLEVEQAFSILALKAENEVAHYLLELSKGARETAEGLFQKYGFTPPIFNQLKKNSACKLYTEEMLSKASTASFNEGLVFLLPCALIYQKVGEHLQNSPKQQNSYQEWIDRYSSSERRARVEKYVDLIDFLTLNASNEEIQHLKTVFYQAAEHEYAFWDSIYNQPVKSALH